MNRILYKGIPFLVTIVISGSSVSTRSIVDGFDPVCCTDYCARNLVFISVQGMQSWDFAKVGFPWHGIVGVALKGRSGRGRGLR